MDGSPVTHASSVLEKVLEHRFIAEVSAALWLRGTTDFEVLRAELDSHGYDVVIEANRMMRHIQLKALRRGGKRREVTLSERLTSKPSGCVVWMVYDPETLALGPFHWLGGAPGEKLADLGDRPARHSKANASGMKTVRSLHRRIRKSAFKTVENVSGLVDVMFGRPI